LASFAHKFEQFATNESRFAFLRCQRLFQLVPGSRKLKKQEDDTDTPTSHFLNYKYKTYLKMLKLKIFSLLGLLALHATAQAGNSSELDCSLQNQVSLASNDVLTFSHVMNPVDETLTVEIVYEGAGWLGFGASANGRMTGTGSVIGLPETGSVQKYYMSDRSLGAVQLVPDSEQTLTDTSITQNATHTVLKFTKPLREDGELEISPTGQNTFIYAVGIVNGLSPHIRDGAFSMQLTPCIGAAGYDADSLSNSVTLFEEDSSTKKLWIAHGVLMALAWGILVPLAIGSSMLRPTLSKLLPKGMWFSIHFYLNMLAMALMVASFGIAVHAINSNTVAGEDPKHFHDVTHRMVGLVIFVIAFVQAAVGMLRPGGPKVPNPPTEFFTASPPPEKDVEATVERRSGHGSNMEMTLHSAEGSSTDDDSLPKAGKAVKSIARHIWEYKHRLTGTTLLGLSWYNCHSGLDLYALRYGDDWTSLFWGITGGITGIIFVLKIVQKVRKL
jgi:hypothetical protein